MRKITSIVLFSVALALVCYAQETVRVSRDAQASFQKNAQVQKLITYFKEKGLAPTGYNAEGTQTFTGKDANGKDVNLSLITYSLADKKKNSIDVVMFADNVGKRSKVWAENDRQIFKVVDNKVSSSSQSSGAAARSTGDCLKQFMKAAGSCSSCVSCVNNCWSKNRKWKRIACAAANCGGSCWSCVKDVWGFINCIFE